MSREAAPKSPPPGRRRRRPGRRGPPPNSEPPAVVLLALVGVRQDVVGLGDLLEALLGLRVARVAVRVVLARELAVGLLDLLLRRPSCRRRGPCSSRVVRASRRPSAATTTRAGRRTVAVEAVALLVDLDDGAGLGALDAAAGPSPRARSGRSARPRARTARCRRAPSAPTSSSWTSRMPFDHVVPPPLVLGAPRSASSRWSSAGSSSLASRATPRSSACGGLARHALAEVLEVGLRALGEREVLLGLGARRGASGDELGDRRRRRPRLGAAGGGRVRGRRRRPGRGGGRAVGGLDGRAPRRAAASASALVRRPPASDRRPVVLRVRLSAARRRPRRRRPPPRRPSRRRRRRAPLPTPAACCCLRALVHRLGDLVERRLQRLGLGAGCSAASSDSSDLADVLDRRLDLASSTASSTASPRSLSWRSAW